MFQQNRRKYQLSGGKRIYNLIDKSIDILVNLWYNMFTATKDKIIWLMKCIKKEKR